MKRLQVVAIQQDLLAWKEPMGCYNLISKLLQHPAQQQNAKQASKKKPEAANLNACRKNIGYGHYVFVIRVLSSNVLAPRCENTLSGLQAKHPVASPPTILDEDVNCDQVTVDSKAVFGAIKSFPRGTSCGRDGLRAQHIIDALSGAVAAVADDLLASIVGVVNLWLAGKCPMVLGEFIANAPRTPLIMPGGWLCPITVGTIWRRLVSKVAAFSIGKAMSSYLGDHQFGVWVPVGGESILHVVNSLLELKGHSDKMSMLLMDFSNAFNMVCRCHLISEVRLHCPGISHWVEFSYARPARLYYDHYILSSALGVQQGDPLGPLLFALTLHPLVKSIAYRCKLGLHARYLDDGVIIGDTLEVAKSLRIIEAEGPSRGLHLNIKKTEIFWPSFDPCSILEGVFPKYIGRPSKGVKLLGGQVSLDLDFMSDMVLGRVNKTIQLMDAIKKLKDPQSEMLLLCNCVGVSRLYFAMRTTNPSSLQQASDLFDDHLLQYFRILITGDRAGFGTLQHRLATLPIKDGGLGIYTMADTRTYCYLASELNKGIRRIESCPNETIIFGLFH
ncbi:uncharacterized protein LOC113344342 [Papaver somniferum]|uniref:uncharacterized protein LOC113344342 n=1 Tax=Papaver somniferum TaxID=3469 RepID=UPI000E6FE7A4|nr:uncharacterized protein LOC113344342 [Papaver somniferum]